MRKFAIVIALTALATLGFGIGTASAQQEVCAVPQQVADASESDPFIEQFPRPGGPGTPVRQTAQGAADSCLQSFEAGAPVLDPLFCGIAEGMVGMGQDPFTSIGNGIYESGNFVCAPTPPPPPPGDDDDDDDNGRGDDDDDDDDGNGGGGGVDPEVLGQNETAGGELPRTGGELQLLGGLSMALTSAGIVIRRFLG